MRQLRPPLAGDNGAVAVSALLLLPPGAWRREVTAAIIGFIAVCILASAAGWAALRWVERRPPAP